MHPSVRNIAIPVIGVLAILCSGKAQSQDRINLRCQSPLNARDIDVTVAGRQNDLLGIMVGGEWVFNDYPASRERMGGGDISCGGDVSITKDIIAVRMGRYNDLPAFYALKYDQNGSLVGAWEYVNTFRDGRDYKVEIKPNKDVFVNFGREHDLYARFCFDFVREVWRIGYDRNSPYVACNTDVVTTKIY